jgi:hypothetical protein
MEPSPASETSLPRRSELFIRKALLGSIKIFLVALLILQGSCASSRKSPSKPAQPPVDRTQLFPDGVYIHQVEILPKDGKARKIKTVVSIQKNFVKLVGLSPFDTTLFHIGTNRLTEETIFKNFQSIPDQVKNEFDSFYRILYRLLVLEPQGEGTSGDFIVEYDPQRLPVLLKSRSSEERIQIGEYDQQGIPRRLHATHAQFKALVTISQYELAK